MNRLQITIPVPGNEPALLTLPQPLTVDTLGCLEGALAGRLAMLRRELDHVSGEAGAVEYASWRQYLMPARQ